MGLALNFNLLAQSFTFSYLFLILRLLIQPQVIMKIKLTSVYVNDPIKAFHFYTEYLGFQEHMFVPEAYLAIVVTPEDPDGTALLLEPNAHPAAKEYQEAMFNNSLPVLVLDATNLHEKYEELSSKGITFTQKPTKTEWGTSAVFEDTCGNLIQIHQD
jgi:predicted enzyme related to lactoylglutathione lyase